MVIAAVLAAGWAFWLHRLGVLDHDDMLSNELIFVRQGVDSLIFRIPWPDQSPLYFLYLRAVAFAGDSPRVFQLVNGVLLSLTLAATYALTLTVSASRTAAACAILLGALSPTSLWLVRFGRMYSLQVLFAALAALFVVRYLDNKRTRDLVAVAAISILSIYTHFLGFLIAAVLFAPLLFEGLRPVIATAAVVALSLPQVVRLVSLVTAGSATRADGSLPALSARFLERVSWFWFVNTGWGALARAGHWPGALYVGSIVVLAIAGLAAMRRRVGIHAAMWILLPLAAVGLLAARMDVRDRYFIWVLPLIWTAVATGAAGALPFAWLDGWRGDLARGVRAALAVAVLAGSVWLLWQKLPERWPEGTRVMTAVAQLYAPTMQVYMPPSSALGIPRLIALQRDFPEGLRDVREMSAATRPQFLGQVEQGQDFIFLLVMGPSNDEMRWRIQYLEGRGYHKAVVPAFAASAQFFTRRPLDTWWAPDQSLDAATSPAAIAAWARAKVHERASAAHGRGMLSDALVARVDPGGAARIARVFASQRGEWGGWRIGPGEWDAVEETRVSDGSRDVNAIAARTVPGSVLVIALPAMAMKRSLDLWCGAAMAEIGLYVNGESKANFWCAGSPGSKPFAVDTSTLERQHADVVMLLTTTAAGAGRVVLRLDPSSDAAIDSAGAAAGPIDLTGGRHLSDRVEDLRVYRLAGERRFDAQADGRTYSAADMHEATGRGGEGSVHRVWALGVLPWDAVGSTRQVSNGDARKGIWAHPKNGTTLVIEATVKSAGLLHAFFGFTDYALRQARGTGVDAPVRFVVSIDGKTAIERDVARAGGWNDITLPVATAPDARVRIQISAGADSWSHFVFDLWSD